MKPEQHNSGGELRAEGRTLAGPAIVYGEVSPGHRERFLPGAFNLQDGLTRTLDIGHDRSRVLVHTDNGGLRLFDSQKALEIRARLPAIPVADKALDMVRAGQLTGFSVDFRALDETRDDMGVRVIKRAHLNGIGLVRTPSYRGSRAEVRQARARSFMPFNVPLPCDCHSGDCEIVAIENITFPDDRDILAIHGNYKGAFGSVDKGTLELVKLTAKEFARSAYQVLTYGKAVRRAVAKAAAGAIVGVGVAVETSSAIGRALAEQSDVAPIYARPVFDQELSEVEEIDGVAHYRNMVVKAVLFGSTDRNGDWPAVAFNSEQRAVPVNDDDLIRRAALWL